MTFTINIYINQRKEGVVNDLGTSNAIYVTSIINPYLVGELFPNVCLLTYQVFGGQN